MTALKCPECASPDVEEGEFDHACGLDRFECETCGFAGQVGCFGFSLVNAAQGQKEACAPEGPRCPCCGSPLESYPEQDASCDHVCAACGWREHVPGAEDIAASLTLHPENQQAAKKDDPTVVIFVEGGCVQGVEGDAPVRVILCDFDLPESPETIGGRPCVMSVWDEPEEPSEEFREALKAAEQDEEEACEEPQ